MAVSSGCRLLVNGVTGVRTGPPRTGERIDPQLHGSWDTDESGLFPAVHTSQTPVLVCVEWLLAR